MQQTWGPSEVSSLSTLGADGGTSPTGHLAFLSPEAQVQRTAELLGAGVLVVVAAPAPGFVRGKLAEHLDDLLERELGARGAPSPYMAAWAAMPEDAEARLADQLFRARSVGASGIAIAMGSLAAIARPALTPEDSETLRVLARVCEAAPLLVMIDDADESVRAYAAPVALAALLGSAKPEAIEEAKAETKIEQAEPEAEVEVQAEVEAEAKSVDTQVDAPVAPVDAPAKAEPRPRAAIEVPVGGDGDEWRSWAIALNAARGPQALASFEKLFVESYMPLTNAIAAGLDDPRAVRAQDEFKRGFERSYTDAFATFGATGRRPRLVMDAFDLASKQARLHNARSAHVIVVDAMRHDLGRLVRDQMATHAAGVASLTAETLLWSALPTTTFRQLETLARGMDALRAPADEEPNESLRGRSAETVRRLRVGSRELYKLDVVPSSLASLSQDALGDPTMGAAEVVAGLDEIAETVTDALLRHVETLQTRTLLLVIGDHGFCVDRRGRVSHGGASPEEVLVPAFAYLIGDLH
ncbi:MAG: hypothetical protein KF819_15265 [Labilithrix sp.]|nr:hypothetical protein [Labilithrix sp.]